MNWNRPPDAELVLPDWAGLGPHPELLLHPSLPKPLHGLNPRTLIGRVWWDEARQAAYLAYRNTCWACGISKARAPRGLLEAHERYEIDWKRGRSMFKGACALCQTCHQFIHKGRLAALVESGEMRLETWAAVLLWGEAVLARAGLKPAPQPADECPWGEWRLVIGRSEFGPLWRDEAEWAERWKETRR